MVKVLISMDDRLLKRIDLEAKRRGLTRSKLVSEIAARQLGDESRRGANPAVHEAIRRADELFRNAAYADTRDSTVIIREMRNSR